MIYFSLFESISSCCALSQIQIQCQLHVFISDSCYVLNQDFVEEETTVSLSSRDINEDELETIKIKDLNLISMVGEGLQGSVYLVENSTDQKKYALKIYKNDESCHNRIQLCKKSRYSFIPSIKID